jgi:hypothetical protein
MKRKLQTCEPIASKSNCSIPIHPPFNLDSIHSKTKLKMNGNGFDCTTSRFRSTNGSTFLTPAPGPGQYEPTPIQHVRTFHSVFHSNVQ